MTSTSPRTASHPHRRPVAAVVALFWFFVTTGLALTASLLLLGGPRIVQSGSVRAVLIAAIVLFVAHSLALYRHRFEPTDDERLRRARERRGF